MYSVELESLIEMAIVDGQLTEKEKRILLRRAQSEGIDSDEFEMVLDARLEKAKSKATSSNYGEARKCPSCGANVVGLQGRCPYCGTTFEGMLVNSAMERLAEAIWKATRESKERYAKTAVEMKQVKARSNRMSRLWDIVNEVDDDTDEVVAGIIKNFPIPNTKTDLMEFIIALKPKTQGSDSDLIKDAYYAKYKECLDKARYMFPDDHEIKHLLKSHQLKGLKKMSPSGRTIVHCLIGIVGGLLLMGVAALLSLD